MEKVEKRPEFEPSVLRDALEAIASPAEPKDFGWWTLTARKALGVATPREIESLRASQPPCPACEGWPKAGNNPCSICGLVTRLVEDQPPDGERKASEGGGP